MKYKKIIALILAMLILPSAIAVQAQDNVVEITVNGVDVDCKNNCVTVYINRTTTGTEGGAEAVCDSTGKVIAIGNGNSTVPQGGMVVSALGNKTYQINNYIKVGDYLRFDEVNMKIFTVPEDYSPFTSTTLAFTGKNTTRVENSLIIYDRSGGKTSSGTNQWGYEAVVDSDGYIISVGGNNNDIPDGGFVMSAIGDKKEAFSNAAIVGYKAILDNSVKTIEIKFDKDCAKQAPSIVLNSYNQYVENAKNNYKILDYTQIDSLASAAQSHYDDICGFVDADNYQSYAVSQTKFDNTIRRLEIALYETPAVEARSLWIRPQQTNAAAVKATVAQIKAMGFNSICIETLYNNTMIFPLPEEHLFKQSPAFGGFDVLAAYVEECHKQGMELHVWMPVFRVGHDASTYPELGLGNQKREWRNLSNTGIDYVANVYGNGHYLNPALPEVTEYLLSVYKYILENYEIDGFQLDYIRYPDRVDNVDYGYDEYTRGLFEEEYGYDPINITTSHALWKDWCAFRAQFVTDFVLDVKDMIAQLRPDVLLSCDVAPRYNESNTRMMQDTTLWLSERYVDVVFTMAYGTNDTVRENTIATVGYTTDGVFAIIGVGDYGTLTFEQQVQVIRNNGGDGVAFFAYHEYDSGGYTEPTLKTVFRNTAVSPFYNPNKAALAQLEYLAKRFDTIQELNGGASQAEEIRALAQDLADKEENITIDDIASIVALDLSGYNDLAKAAVGVDVDLLKKIVIHAKERPIYQEETDPAESQEESSEVSQIPTIIVPPQSVVLPINIGIAAAVVVAGVIIFIKRKK